MHAALSGENNMSVQSENLAHACSYLLELSFAWNGSKESVAAGSDESARL